MVEEEEEGHRMSVLYFPPTLSVCLEIGAEAERPSVDDARVDGLGTGSLWNPRSQDVAIFIS